MLPRKLLLMWGLWGLWGLSFVAPGKMSPDLKEIPLWLVGGGLAVLPT
jgi:hypothetical protein